MNQKKASIEYGILELKEDFPVLSGEATPNMALPPLIGVIWEKFRQHLEKNSARVGITHTRNTSDPHFACRTFQMVVHGRIIEMTIPYNYIDEKDYCGMPCRIVFTSDLLDVPIIENLMLQLRQIVRKQDVEVLKKEVLEHIKEALRTNERLYLTHVYSAVRNFYGDYELRKLEEELYRERRANAIA